MTWLNSPQDCKWLRETHLPKTAPKFKSAGIRGNEDCPEMVELYSQSVPTIYDKPIKTYHADQHGSLHELS